MTRTADPRAAPRAHLQRRRELLIVTGLGLAAGLAGCAIRGTGPGKASAPASMQVHGDLQMLMDVAGGGSDLPDAELRRLRAMPLRPPGDPAAEASLLRRGLAALLLGDEAGVRSIQRPSGAPDRSLLLTVSIEQLVMAVDMLQGRFAQAAQRMSRIERMAGGEEVMAMQLMISVSSLIDSGQLSAGEAMIDRLPATLGSRHSALDRWNYDGERVRLRAHIARGRGHMHQASDSLARWLEQPLPAFDADVPVQAQRAAYREALNRWTLVDALATRGRLDAALRHAERVFELARQHDTPALRRFADNARLSLALATGDYEQALRTLQALTVPALERHWILPRRARRLLVATAAAGAQRWELARAELDALGAPDTKWPRPQLLRATALDAYVAARRGDDTGPAVQRMAKAAANLQYGEVSEQALLHHGALSIALASGEQTARSTGALQAATEFRRVLGTMRRTDLGLDLTWPRSALREASESGLLILTLQHMQGRADIDALLDALALAQESEIEQSVADALLRRSGGSGLAAEDLRRLQLARQTAREAILARTGMEEALRALDETLAPLETRSPLLAGQLALRPVSAAELHRRLLPGELLLALVPLRRQTVVLAATRDGVRVALQPSARSEIAAWLTRLRNSCVKSGDREVLPPFDEPAARHLRGLLFSGVEDLIERSPRLTIATGGLLAALPFAALPEPGAQSSPAATRWLGGTVTLTQAVSLRQWMLSGDASASQRETAPRLLSWADPDVGGNARAQSRGLIRLPLEAEGPQQAQAWAALRPGLARLPHARAEAAMLAGLFEPVAVSVRTGTQATRSSVMQAHAAGRPGGGILHFATHALAPGEVRNLGQPALVMAAEDAEPRSQWLTLDDVMSLHVDAGLVLLSACTTTAAARPGGDAMTGLVRGFLFAGARAVMATHWPVDDELSARFVVDAMQTHLRTRVPLADALRQSMHRQAEGYPSRPGSHPAHWAGWVLVGG